MHDSGELNTHASVQGEESKVVVHVVNHHVGGIHLCGELTKDAGEDNHGKSNIEEDELDTIGETKHINGGVERRGALVDHENDEKHHELTSHQITVQVVSLECQGSILVGERMAVLVKIRIDGRETNERCLLSLNHGKPNDS